MLEGKVEDKRANVDVEDRWCGVEAKVVVRWCVRVDSWYFEVGARRGRRTCESFMLGTQLLVVCLCFVLILYMYGSWYGDTLQ